MFGVDETLIPAYGRDYNSRKALLTDWIAGKDFLTTMSSKYCSSRDFTRNVTVRYKQNTRVAVLKYDADNRTWK